MANEVKLPQLGQTTQEGSVVGCPVKVGDEVKKGDVIFEVEIDKATLEMESPASGFVKHIVCKVGESLAANSLMMILGGKDEQVDLPSTAAVVKPPQPGQIVEADVPAAAQTLKTKLRQPRQKYKLGQRVPLSRLGKIVAQKALQSKREIPCFYLNIKADVTDMVKLRAQLNKSGNVKIAFNDFIMRALAMGIQHYPMMTGQIDGDNIQLSDSIGIGLAISVPGGLTAPIVKDAGAKTLTEIAACSKALIERAQNNKLSPDDLAGGCITLSNLGAMDIDSFIPIVVPGQCSILGVGKITDSCIPSDGEIPVRKIMNMTLSVDHRVVNGAEAAQFLDFVAKLLAEPEKLI